MLKECPYCRDGDDNPDLNVEICDLYGNFHVYCTFCGMSGPEKATEIQAINSWNFVSAEKECLKNVLELARDGLDSVRELLTEHPVLKGHSEKIRFINTCYLVVDRTVKAKGNCK